ncbi:uncharacterized protein FIBRA_06466 [Fibroporia radiculosa]|uniref:XLF-like N-terminal domain-containing protein n=1 Tax=Fibroporia radiculosa TaxID=599839 RepID=J4GSS8_9APHY|nr:uncharacterized protein FIBRA_06466 [Fibroporia radiculosa]CCM04295.1 predicted protein [Fibroporia radiculosa]
MDYMTEEHYKLLLSREWLVKIDTDKSTPFFLKFYSSTVDLCCHILITDTKNVWAEVLTSNRIARRWRDHNPECLEGPTAEEEWRTSVVKLLSSVHTLGGIMDLSFEVVESQYSDFAFELGSETFKWRWETCHVGPKISAEIISKHLVMPLISVTHLAFSSADPVGELSQDDLEQAVDKLGRTGRRTVDTHLKHAMSRPRVATAVRRMTAMFNFLPELPAISLDVDQPDLSLPSIQPRSRAPSSKYRDGSVPSRPLSPPMPFSARTRSPTSISPEKSTSPLIIPEVEAGPSHVADDSVTESEDDEIPASLSKGKQKEATPRRALPRGRTSSPSRPPTRVGSKTSRQATTSRAITPEQTANHGPVANDSSPPSSPPTKKAKRAVVPSSSDDDSEAERKKRVAQIKSSANRGAKQPLRRGGRRF